MSQDATDRSSSGEETYRPPAFLPCSDCRQPMRNHYFALDTRPVCGKCRAPYEKRIAYARGPGSLARVLFYGGGAALLGAIVMGFVGFALILSAPLAWIVAKAINKATGDYFLRRNAIIAVVLVYAAIGTSVVVPVVFDAMRTPAAEASPAAAAADEAAPPAVDEDGEPIADAPEDILADEPVAEVATTPDEIERQKAAQLREGGIVAGVITVVVLFFTLPLIVALSYGIAGAGIALLAFGFAMHRAWVMTNDGVSYELSGPFRVGTGPIPTTW